MNAANNINCPKEMAESFWNNYAAVGWVDAAGRLVTNMPAALAKWKANQASRGQVYQAPTLPPAVLVAVEDYVKQAVEIIVGKKGEGIGRFRAKVRDTLGKDALSEMNRRVVEELEKGKVKT